MTRQEKDIIKETKEFAKANGLYYDKYTESMIVNAIREVQQKPVLPSDEIEKKMWDMFNGLHIHRV